MNLEEPLILTLTVWNAIRGYRYKSQPDLFMKIRITIVLDDVQIFDTEPKLIE